MLPVAESLATALQKVLYSSYLLNVSNWFTRILLPSWFPWALVLLPHMIRYRNFSDRKRGLSKVGRVGATYCLSTGTTDPGSLWHNTFPKRTQSVSKHILDMRKLRPGKGEKICPRSQSKPETELELHLSSKPKPRHWPELRILSGLRLCQDEMIPEHQAVITFLGWCANAYCAISIWAKFKGNHGPQSCSFLMTSYYN